MKKFFNLALVAGLLAMLVAGCTEIAAQPTAKNTQSEIAAQAANSIQFTENAEIENITRRLELTSQPGLLGFIILLNDAGQPVVYEGVRGKVTSGGKRLTAPVQRWDIDGGEWGAQEIAEAPSDEGTWGSSSPYIFYWNTNGEYRQWSGAYLYSDKPFRLNVEPLVVSVLPAESEVPPLEGPALSAPVAN